MADTSLWAGGAGDLCPIMLLKLALQETHQTILLISSNWWCNFKAFFKGSRLTWLKPIHQVHLRAGVMLCVIYIYFISSTVMGRAALSASDRANML